MQTMSSIETILHENRQFSPPKDFAQQANIGEAQYNAVAESAVSDPVRFWESAAQDLHWFRSWDKVLEWKEPTARWFVNAKINASFNCLDRHLSTATRDRLAIIWEGEEGGEVRLTYLELYEKVCRLANVLELTLGLKPGDTAAIYMPMTPEAIITMLACARV